MEYIPREEILAEYDRQHSGPPGGARKIMETWPAADVAPVRHGRWELDVLDGTPGYRPVCIVCSECHRISYAGFPYCPNCGAKME